MHKAISVLFWIAALYDGVLGLLFLAAGPAVFERFDVTPPNHWGYVQFPALLLLVFAWLFARVALDPAGRRDLIPFGMGLKAAYCGVVFYHWALAGIPWIWQPFAILDLAFLALFVWAWSRLGR